MVPTKSPKAPLSSLQVIIHGSSVPTRSLSRALTLCALLLGAAFNLLLQARPPGKRTLTLSSGLTPYARRCSPLRPVTSSSLSLLNLDTPKPCVCFWKLSTYITFPARSALLRPFSSHSPPASSHHAPKPVYGPAILVFDCLLRLRHSALLGDRRQRFFFADLGSVQGPVTLLPPPCMLAQACAAIRLYLLATPSTGGPGSWLFRP